MKKRLLLQVSVTTLVAFFVWGCAKEKRGTGPDYEQRMAGKKEIGDKMEERKAVEKEKKTPRPWQISTGSGYCSFPAWSPDGQKIAYAVYQEGKEDIWVVEVDEDGRPKGVPVNITNSAGMDERPSWSPDGKRLVFHSDREGGKRKLFIVDADGSNLELLYQHQTERGLSESFNPSWAPEGERIAFVAENNIWVIDKEGKKEPRNITSSGYNDYPSWSPDGKRLVFYSGSAIKLVKADGTGERKLTGSGGMRSDFPGWSGYPSWSPDGKKIAFISNKKKTRKGKKVEYYDLWIVKADGTGKAEYLTNDEYREYFPAWSPQGDKLAFQSNRKDGFYIWAVSLSQ